MRQKHGLSLFITSCIPGCGQMHQGYMKRGLSLLTAFCGLFFLAVFLELGALTVLMLPLWLYSFFDSYNLRSQIADGTPEPDVYLFGLSDVDSEKISVLLRKRHSVIGWGLVLLGVYILWQRVADWLGDFFRWIFPSGNFYYTFRYGIPRIVVSVGIIALGVWFIRGPRRAKQEDIPAFVPPADTAVPDADAGEAPGEEAPHGDD